MKIRSIVAVAALLCAFAASASADYVAELDRLRNPLGVARAMASDPALADPAALRAAYETVDAACSTGRFVYPLIVVPRCFPLSVRASLAKSGYSARVRDSVLSRCGYGERAVAAEVSAGDPDAVNGLLQRATTGVTQPTAVRREILGCCIRPARRLVRAEGGTTVGEEGARNVKAKLDEVAAALNSPRFGNAGELLAALGFDVEWEHVVSMTLTDAEVGRIRAEALDGRGGFGPVTQRKLEVALGVSAYNEFVREYNGR